MNRGRGKPTRLAEVKVGIFVIVATAILALAVFNIGTRVGLLEETFRAKTYLNDTSGLKPSDIVLIGGVEAGNVGRIKISKPGEMPPTESNQINRARIRELENLAEEERRKPAPDEKRLDEIQSGIDRVRRRLQNVEVYLDIKQEYRVWIQRDSNISLGSIGLLGDKYVEVSLGRSNEPALVVEEKFETWFGVETDEVLVITGSTESGFRELIIGANDVLVNVEALSGRLEEIMQELGEGKGTVGQFLTNPEFFNKVNLIMASTQQTTERVATLVERLIEGSGTVPSLIREDDIYQSIRGISARMDEIIRRIEQGEGTLGKLSKDPSLYDRIEHTTASLESITKRMEAGEGTLGRLSTDDQLYVDLRRTMDQMAEFLEAIQDGEGTLGRLAKDEALYQNLNHLTSEMVKLIHDFRQDPRKFLTIRFKLF
jgi:phospholipid/cholesterol/gamma-HCH transport system substrate-binding protein